MLGDFFGKKPCIHLFLIPWFYVLAVMYTVDRAEDYIDVDERLCSFIDDDDCRATFVYGYHNLTGQLQVWVQKTKECPVVVDIMGIVLGVIGAIVAIGKKCAFKR